MIELRDYQQKALDNIAQAALDGKRKILLTMPTGSGKSLVALSIAIHAMRNGKRSLIWAPRREICWQMGAILREEGIEYGLILADEPHDPNLPIQIASIQSLYVKGLRRKTIAMPRADVVIADEGHHSLAETHQKVIALYPDAFHVGMTATPVNKCGAGLGNFYETLILGPSIKQLMDDGYLSRVKYWCPSIPDLAGLKIQAGDYSENQLSERVDKVQLIGDIIQNFSRICPKAKTIVSACGVAHSQHIAHAFNSVGVQAAHIDGGTPTRERDRIVDEYRAGKIQVISNADVFSEGVDFPDIECLIFARPTKSLGRYLQICGRGLRPSPGKKELILLDHSGAVMEHGMLDDERDWKLDYGKDKTINKAMRKQKEKKLKAWITCEKCKALYTGRLDCPECGNIVTIKGRPVPTYEAWLEEITGEEKHKYATDDKSIWWRGFVWHAQQKPDYKLSRDGLPALAYALFREKFGAWPGPYKHSGPLEPPLDVKSWIKSRQIKWAMRRRKPDWKPREAVATFVPSHGLSRKDDMGGNAFAPDFL